MTGSNPRDKAENIFNDKIREMAEKYSFDISDKLTN